MPIPLLSQLYLGDNPFFFGPAVSCPEINDATLGKMSKIFFLVT